MNKSSKPIEDKLKLLRQLEQPISFEEVITWVYHYEQPPKPHSIGSAPNWLRRVLQSLSGGWLRR